MLSTYSAYWILSTLSIFIIVSYIFELISRRTKIPTVLFLLGLGMSLRIAADYYQTPLPNFQPYLEIFGIVGLILIVLEAALDLKLSKEILPTIARSLSSAVGILLATIVAITAIIYYWGNFPMKMAIINAIPLAVVSSAIVIPSVAHLTNKKKEFLIYETTFSDILGIMIFNFAIFNDRLTIKSLAYFGTELIVISILSLISCLVLLLLIEKLKIKLKAFLIIALLILFYSVGKIFHYSTLFLILGFGLMLNNTDLFIKGKLQQYFKTNNLHTSLKQFKIIALEFTFLIRTLFFILFGYSLHIQDIIQTQIIILGASIVGAIFLVRLIYLRFFAKSHLFPELFIAPRGLITVLLFYSIPTSFRINDIGQGVLFFVVICTGIIMMLGLMIENKRTQSESMDLQD